LGYNLSLHVCLYLNSEAVLSLLPVPSYVALPLGSFGHGTMAAPVALVVVVLLLAQKPFLNSKRGLVPSGGSED
jgi:hypothetical protein